MYVEAPEIKRCCCCLPSRHGIILWAYIKIILSLMALVPLLMLILVFFPMIRSADLFFGLLAILALKVDIIMSIIALIGGHLKKVDLLKIYYKYSIVSIVLSIFIFLVILIIQIFSYSFYTGRSSLKMWYLITWTVATGLATFAVQVYMLLVLRSKLQKLTNNCDFRFVNHAAEAECSMDYNQLTWNWQGTPSKNNQFDKSSDPLSKKTGESSMFEENNMIQKKSSNNKSEANNLSIDDGSIDPHSNSGEEI